VRPIFLLIKFLSSCGFNDFPHRIEMGANSAKKTIGA
jgi:hypothetical protein